MVQREAPLPPRQRIAERGGHGGVTELVEANADEQREDRRRDERQKQPEIGADEVAVEEDQVGGAAPASSLADSGPRALLPNDGGAFRH